MMAFTHSPKWGEGKHFRKRFVGEDQKILILEGAGIQFWRSNFRIQFS